MFPNLERVDYNFIDSRLNDKVYWPLKLSDIWESKTGKNDVVSKVVNHLSSALKEPKGNRISLEYSTIGLDYKPIDYSKDVYLSEIPMHGKMRVEVNTGYKESFKELKKQSPLIDLNLNEIKATTKSLGEDIIPWVEGNQHPKISDYVLKQLIHRRKYKNERSYKAADYIRDDLLRSGLEVVSENADGSQIIINDHRELNDLEYHILKAAEDAYLDKSSRSLMDFQALMHEYFFEETIKKYAETSGKSIHFSGVNAIKYGDKLNRSDYNHVLEDHNNQQAVYLPVLQGAGNGDVKKHKEYILDKYIRAHEENSVDYDIPRMIITPKNYRSIFSM